MNEAANDGVAMTSTSKRGLKSGRAPTRQPGETLRVTLPGKAYQRGNRWWWCVKLPGEEKARSRPLKAQEAKVAVSDRKAAEAAALEIWEQAVREQAEKQTRAESSQTIARLKAQFLDKVRHFTKVVESANAKAQAEARARAEAEAKLKRIAEQRALRTGSCECCGAAGLPVTKLRRIDSGQLLCPRCLEALRADASRVFSPALAECSTQW